MENLRIGKQPVSKRKVAIFVISVVASGFFAYLAQPKYHDNANAILVVVTVFSVLAGFLVTVMAILADERSLRGSNWKQDAVYFALIKKDLRRHRDMFYLYLLVLSIAFIASLNFKDACEIWQTWVERAVVFFGSLAMVWSFRLPGSIMRQHLENLDRKIKERRQKDGTADR